MTTPDEAQALLPVTQMVRNAAAEIARAFPIHQNLSLDIVEGMKDDMSLVQTFARFERAVIDRQSHSLPGDVGMLQDALIQHNERLRSAVAIADREGADTNWLAFRGQARFTLAEYQDIVNEARAAVSKRYGYAPGNYTIICIDCKKHCDGCDKRAIRCEDCAAALTPSPCPGDGMRGLLVEVQTDLINLIDPLPCASPLSCDARAILKKIDAALTPSALSGEEQARKIAREVCDRRNLKRDNGLVYGAALEAAKEALGLSALSGDAGETRLVRASREAIELIDELNERATSRKFWGISQTMHNKLCTIRVTLARALPSHQGAE